MIRKRSLLYKGKMVSYTELSQICGKSEAMLRYRITKMGMTPEQAATKPTRRAEPNFPCGAKVFYDCLDCKFPDCISLAYPPMPGEGISDYGVTDYTA